MRLIDADALIEVLEGHRKDCEDAYKSPGGNGWEYMRQAYVTAIGEVKIQETIGVPKLNGKPDTDMIADMIVSHIIAKLKENTDSNSNHIMNNLQLYVEDVLNNMLIVYSENK